MFINRISSRVENLLGFVMTVDQGVVTVGAGQRQNCDTKFAGTLDWQLGGRLGGVDGLLCGVDEERLESCVSSDFIIIFLTVIFFKYIFLGFFFAI